MLGENPPFILHIILYVAVFIKYNFIYIIIFCNCKLLFLRVLPQYSYRKQKTHPLPRLSAAGCYLSIYLNCNK